ncbi:ZIP family metal transporter [Rheinheimera salexigens]|uniref:Divalent cation transporter n=1 Tax=Rheinheimera salexigens TaxID=1628148 RepID=A0A1E7Q8X7_9GAMM|nr:ZIP family metal transporter [Rheinheimera salexigens]OEY70634.1 divalent cation transporter [Rheinheimera salexigens]
MSDVVSLIVITLAAGLTMSLGASIAAVEHIHRQWLAQELRHSVLAFGAGALLSAVALVLVPEGIEHQTMIPALLWFCAGGVGFMLLDMLLKKIDTPASQLAAMLADFIPESIALGAAFVVDRSTAMLLAGLIALQNLPEGFNAFRELTAASSYRRRTVIIVFAAMALLGPIAALIGHYWLANSAHIISAMVLFAAGGILYSVFQDMAPQIKLDKHWGPPLGTVLGFALGVAGLMLTH